MKTNNIKIFNNFINFVKSVLYININIIFIYLLFYKYFIFVLLKIRITSFKLFSYKI